MTVGEGIAWAGLFLAIALVVSSTILAAAWMDVSRMAKVITELEAMVKPAKSRRAQP